jgi:hypothetical protein
VQRNIVTSATSTFDELPPGIDAIALPLVSPARLLACIGADVTTMDILARFRRVLEAIPP